MNPPLHRDAGTSIVTNAPCPGLVASRFPLLVCLLMTAAGCSSLTRQVAPATVAAEESPAANSIQLTYRTDSGRLNQLAGGQNSVRQVSLQQNATTAVPPFTTSTMTVNYPHPAGLAGQALVTVTFSSQTESEETSWLWSKLSGQTPDDDGSRAAGFREVWQADLPEWQLASLMAQLKEKHFFRRVKLLGCNSHVETEINGNRFAKDFPEVPDLDALILDIRRHGRLVSPSAAAHASNAPYHRDEFSPHFASDMRPSGRPESVAPRRLPAVNP